jgi:hypothetical protein
MVTIFQDRHSGMDSRQAILPDALRVNANLFQTDLCRNPGSRDGFELAIHGAGYPLPGGYDELTHNSDKVELMNNGCKEFSLPRRRDQGRIIIINT